MDGKDGDAIKERWKASGKQSSLRNYQANLWFL
ncbi:hypothetical protein J2X61_006379 [Bacillus sp. 3255]|nr:hypothetical protein [Bacillus sp. 3255]